MLIQVFRMLKENPELKRWMEIVKGQKIRALIVIKCHPHTRGSGVKRVDKDETNITVYYHTTWIP